MFSGAGEFFGARRVRMPNPIMFVVGLMLIAAGVLEGHECLSVPYACAVSRIPSWLKIAWAELEFAVGIWLVSGYAARLGRWIAMSFFTCFAIYNVHQIYVAAPSCDGLGRFQFDPHFVLALDVVVLSALALVTPRNVVESAVIKANLTKQRASCRKAAFLLVATGLFLGGVVSWRALLRAESMVPVGVSVDAHEFNFGDVRAGQTLTHTFTLLNRSPDSITIVRVISTCGCSIIEGIEGSVVPANTDLPVPITFHTGDTHGERAVALTVFYRHPTSRYLASHTFRVRANVVTDYVLSERLVEFGKVRGSQPLRRVIYVQPQGLQNLRVLRVQTDSPGFAAVVGPPEESGVPIEIILDPKQISRPGVVSSVLTINSTSSQMAAVPVYLRAYVEPIIEVSPGSVVVGAGETGVVERDVKVRVPNDSQLSWSEPSHPGVRIDRVSQKSNEQHLLRITIDDNSQRSINCTIELRVELQSDKGMPAVIPLSVPVHRLASNLSGRSSQ